MVIPAIDFQGGKVVQLVQGERLALERPLAAMLEQFRDFPDLQIVDLDAAKGEGDNRELVRLCCQAGHRVRVGGGLRSLARAEEVLAWGAEKIIVSSAAFGPDGANRPFLSALARLGPERVIIAVDSRDGAVAVRGWRQRLPLDAAEAMRQTAEFCGEFLYTHVDTEGLMGGIPLERVRALRALAPGRLSVAGGIADLAQIRALQALGCDSVLGMAIYTGRLALADLLPFARPSAATPSHPGANS